MSYVGLEYSFCFGLYVLHLILQEMRSKNEKSIATSSKVPQRKARQSQWPRPEGKPFDLPTHLDPRHLTRKSSHRIEGHHDRRTLTEWCDYHSIFYNGMLNVAIEPTRTVDMEMLREMGIDTSVTQLFQEMGIGTMPYANYDLYPDLVRQFLATCEIPEHPKKPTALHAQRFSFFCNGKRHSLFIEDIGDIYKWDMIRWDRKYSERTLNKMEDFWEAMGHGDFNFTELKIARIRNPTLRIAAKALAHTFFCKEEADRISKSVLALLFTGINKELRHQLIRGNQPCLDRIRLSRMFVEILADRKYRGLGSSSDARIESIGSLITPILIRARVDLSNATVDTRRTFMDKAYLEHTRIIRNGIYQWTTGEGIPRYCTLPRPTWTSIDTLDQIRFEVPSLEQCTSDGKILPEFDTNPDPIRVIYCDEPDQFCQHGNPLPDPSPLATDFPAEFYESIPPLPAGASWDDWRGQRDRVQQQQTTILRGIVNALTHVTWIPPAPCCSTTQEDAEEQHD